MLWPFVPEQSKLIFSSANNTFTQTVTDNTGKYICLLGFHLNPNTFHYSTPQGPLSYAGPTLTLNSAGADKEYATGDHIEVTAAFGYNVTVDTTSGTPRIGLTVGSNTRYATYNSDASDTSAGNLAFRYTVVAADVDSDGVSIAANALALNSGTLQDSGNTDAVITHPALAASANHKVNPPAGTAPTVTKVSYHTWANAHIPTAASATGPHSYGTALFVRFTFSEAMTFTKGWGDAARPAFARVVNGAVGTRLGVVERIAGPGQE